jgi:predicted oxidoreductase
MERGLGLPDGSLQRTLARYNAHAAKGEDPDLHKHPDWLAPQDHGPWGALDLTLGKALYAGFTLGGISTDVDGRVHHDDGSVIHGLYAACAANLAQDGKGYASGTRLGEGRSSVAGPAGTLPAAGSDGRHPTGTPSPVALRSTEV